MKIEILLGDITNTESDIIVNSANKYLRRGGGVCGAIHKVAGPELERACLVIGGCETGSAKLTPAYNLPATFVAHAVGPTWDNGSSREEELLFSCYKTCMDLAVQRNAKSISFPAISTGLYHFPLEIATSIAFEAIQGFAEHDIVVRLVCFDQKTYALYKEEYAQRKNDTYDAAQASSWQVHPLSEKNATIESDVFYTTEQMSCIRRGFIPRQMEDKWFFYWSHNRLYAHRSWTGYCIFVAYFQPQPNGSVLYKIELCQDEEQYSGSTHNALSIVQRQLQHLIYMHSQ